MASTEAKRGVVDALACGDLAAEDGDMERARAFSQSALDGARALDDMPLLVRALSSHGSTCLCTGDHDAAIQCYRELSEMPIDSMPRDVQDGSIHLLLGAAYKNAGKLDLAIEAFTQAVRVVGYDVPLRNSSETRNTCEMSLESLGLAYKARGKYKLAAAAFFNAEGTMRRRDVRDKSILVRLRAHAASACVLLGEPALALEWADSAYHLWEATSDVQLARTALGPAYEDNVAATIRAVRGRAHMCNQDWDRAEEELTRAVRIFEESGIAECVLSARIDLADCYIGAIKYGLAADTLNAARMLDGKGAESPELCISEGRLHRLKGRITDAHASFSRALELVAASPRLAEEPVGGLASLLLGDTKAALNDAAGALECYEHAQTVFAFTVGPTHEHMLGVYMGLSTAHAMLGETHKAAEFGASAPVLEAQLATNVLTLSQIRLSLDL
jgi:tetratricopeptide (TPR) repeat protein